MNRFLIQHGWVGLVFAFVASVAFTGCTSKKAAPPENVLRRYEIAKIKGLDPAHTNDLYSGKQVAHAYESLLQYHYLKRPYELEPNLAAEMPKVSADRKTITIKVKQGVLFHDDPCFKKTNGKGRELVAQDFVYSFMRLADPKELSEGWWILDGRVVGLNEWREKSKKAGKTNYDEKIEGLQALDRYTLQIRLKQPSAQFLYYLAMGFTSAVPREAVEMYGKDFLRNPVGTGPFIYDREKSNLNSKLIWHRNPTYRKVLYPSEGEPSDKKNGLLADAGKTIPFVDRVEVTIFIESQPMWLNFLSGKLDYAGIPKDNYAQAISPGKGVTDELAEKGIRLSKTPSLDVTHTSFNMEHPVLGKNKYLRQAMSTALNGEVVIELFFNHRAIAAQGPIPPGLGGYDPKFKNPYRQYSVEKAKELLKKAGFPGGKGLPAFRYATLASSTSRQLAEFFVKSMSQIGIKIKVDTYTWPEFQRMLRNKKGEIYGYAWNADYPDAENFLQLFYGKNVSPGSNDANYVNPEFDRLYEKALALDPVQQREERHQLYRQMEEIVVEDVPWIMGVHRLSYVLTHSWLHNLKPHDFESVTSKYYRVDAQKRSEMSQKLK